MRYLHDYDLGAPMDDGEILTHLRNARGSDVLRGVLQCLRNKAAEICYAGRQPPPERLQPGDFRAYHDGGADALDEVFRKLHDMAESAIPEDEAGGQEGD